MAYTQTMFPNIIGHRTWQDSHPSIEYLLICVVETLIGGECHLQFRMLSCSVLAPRCEGEKMQRPCRSVCQAVHKKCRRAFVGIDMAWPYFLDCDRFFVGHQEGCFNPLENMRGERRALHSDLSSNSVFCFFVVAFTESSLHNKTIQKTSTKKKCCSFSEDHLGAGCRRNHSSINSIIKNSNFTPADRLWLFCVLFSEAFSDVYWNISFACTLR